MKRVYLSVRLLLSAGAAFLLGWLGSSGCSKTPDAGMAEYGAPTVNYEFRARVTDRDARPVEGLQVDLPSSYGDEKELTDAQGDVEIDRNYTGSHRDHRVVLEVKDIDGRKDGVIVDEQVIIEVKESDLVDKGFRKRDNGRVKKAIEIQMERK